MALFLSICIAYPIGRFRTGIGVLEKERLEEEGGIVKEICAIYGHCRSCIKDMTCRIILSLQVTPMKLSLVYSDGLSLPGKHCKECFTLN